MQEASLSELTARVAALEAVTRSLLGVAMARDDVFAESIAAVARDAGEVVDEVSAGDMRLRLQMYAMAIRDAVEAGRRISAGFRATARWRPFVSRP